MNIRPATSDDVPGVLPMVEKICALHERWDPEKYGFLDDVARMYRSWLASRTRDGRSVFLVAEADAGGGGARPALVGYLVATVERDIPIYKVQEHGFVHDLWVEPDYRHEGVARQMVMLAVERFAELGVTQIRLETAAANEPARALFEQCGFRVSTVDMLMSLKEA